MVTTRVTQVGKYQMVRLIGQGGMGSVYLAADSVLGRQVALKILHQHLCRSEEMLGRFRNEAVTHAKLEHANIIRLYDFLTVEELWLIAMEYVPGGRNLGDLVHGTPLPQRVACDVLRQVLRGVAYAHGEGVIHRDIKPPNILIGEERGRIRPKLTDFGIAKALHTTSMTQPGSVLGTVDYMSPEQCLGKPVDQRSDLYSLGVVFYECLTGRVPFQAATEYQVMQAHVDTTPERPDRYNPDLLPGLVALCLRALEKDPEHRYQTANAVLDDLDALAGEIERLPDEPFELPPPRITTTAADDVGESDTGEGRSIQEAPTAFATSQPRPPSRVAGVAMIGTSPTRSVATPSPGALVSGRVVSTRSLDAPVTTAAPPEESRSEGRRGGRAVWIVLLLLLLGAGAAAGLYYFRFREVGTQGNGTQAGPGMAPLGDQAALRQAIDAGRYVEALEALLAHLPTVGLADASDVALLAELLERSAGVLPPERRAQAAQALKRVLSRSPEGTSPSGDLLVAALRAVSALADGGDLAQATPLVATASQLDIDPALAGKVFATLASAVQKAGSFDEAFAVVRLLSEIPPNSPLYEAARRALGSAKDALLLRERVAAADALRAGRWTDAGASLVRLQTDLGDTTESTRQLALKAKDLLGTTAAGACVPVGLARLRDASAASRNVGRPQIAWTGHEYIAVWSDARAAPENSAAQQVYLQRLDASGKRLIDSDQAVSQPGADAGRPTIDCLGKLCGVVWDEFTGTERRVVFQPLDFLGSPVASSTILATGVSAAAYPTVAAARSGSLVVYAVAWVGREVLDEEKGVAREAAVIAFLDHEGKLLDGPRFPRAPPPEASAAPGKRATRATRVTHASKPRTTLTRLPHVVGLGDDGFAAAWEEEGEGQVAVMLAAYASTGGEPRWVQKVIPQGVSSRTIEGRIPFLAFHPDPPRIAVLWVDRFPAVDALVATIYDPAGSLLGSSIAGRGNFRYHGGLYVGDDLVAARWLRGQNKLGISICPLGSGCPETPETNPSPAGIPLASLGGRVGLAPGAARGEFAALWRERPGVAAPSEEGETDEAQSVGDEIFFVRFRCGGA